MTPARLVAAAILVSAQAAASGPAAAWLPRRVADLTVLDKVSARVSPLSVKVGEVARVGPLSIAIRGCFVRPDNVAADATAFFDVTDTTPGAPEFHAWMVASAPAVSAMQHPVYDVRLVTCR